MKKDNEKENPLRPLDSISELHDENRKLVHALYQYMAVASTYSAMNADDRGPTDESAPAPDSLPIVAVRELRDANQNLADALQRLMFATNRLADDSVHAVIQEASQNVTGLLQQLDTILEEDRSRS